MKEESYSYPEEEGIAEHIDKFEENILQGRTIFFDVHEFEQIIEYYLSDENISMAGKAIKMALSIFPNSIELLYKKAEYLHIADKNEQSREVLRYLNNFDSNNPELHYLTGEVEFELVNTTEAIRAFDRAVELANENKSEMLYRISSFFLDIDEVNIAVRFLLSAYRDEPDNLTVLFDLGYCYERNNELEKSVRYYNEYLDIYPFSSSVWYNLGIVYAKLGKFDQSIDCYDYSMAIDPAYSSAYHNKANTLAGLERYDEAAKVFRELTELEPENPRIYALLGDCYKHLKEHDKALDSYNRAITIDPEFAEGFFGIGMLMVERKRLDVGLNFIQRAITLDPEQFDFWMGLGRVRFELNQIDESVKAYREATMLNPNEPEPYLALAEVLLFQEKFRDVENLVDELAPRFTSNASFKVLNAAALYLTKREKEALDILKDAKKIDPASINDFFNLVSVVNDDEFINSVKRL